MSPSTPVRATPSPSPTKSPPPAPVITSYPTTPNHSPPGFPAQPQYPKPSHDRNVAPPLVINSVINNQTDAYSINTRELSIEFYDADLLPTADDEWDALASADYKGKPVRMGNVVMFRTSSGHFYQPGHGRHKCSWSQCVQSRGGMVPNNCGCHPQWPLPPGFNRCHGAFCQCLRIAHNGYYE